MAQERSEAIVIRGVDFSETSRIVTFLTPERGKIACMATGARRAKSPLAGLLDTFNRLEIVYYWKDGRSVQKLGEAALLHAYSGIKADLEKGAYAAVALEFVYKVAQENEPSRALWDTLIGGLDALELWNGDVRVHASWQLIQLLAAAGFEPDLDSVGTFEDGGAPHTTAAQLNALRTLLGSGAACGLNEDCPGLFGAVRRYMIRHLDTEFRSLRVIDQLFDRQSQGL